MTTMIQTVMDSIDTYSVDVCHLNISNLNAFQIISCISGTTDIILLVYIEIVSLSNLLAASLRCVYSWCSLYKLGRNCQLTPTVFVNCYIQPNLCANCHFANTLTNCLIVSNDICEQWLTLLELTSVTSIDLQLFLPFVSIAILK